MYKALLLVLIFIISLSSCGSDDSTGGVSSSNEEKAQAVIESGVEDNYLSAPSRELRDTVNNDFNSLNGEVGNF